MSTATELPVPAFYNAKNATSWGYSPNQENLFKSADAWRKQYGLKGAGSQKRDIHLLLIDVQKDFCFPEGSLYVGGRSGKGALEDNDRIAQFIYRNLGNIKNITTTMDTHFAFQIFFASFWQDRDGKPLSAHTVITTADIREGKVEPNPMVAWFVCGGNLTWLRKQVLYYCEELEKAGKYTLYLWPYHCMLGSDGHPLVGVIHEARMFHAFTRGSQSMSEVKGGNELTENYSVLRPEVMMRFDGHPLAQKNTKFIKTLMEADAVIVGGQAASHCVKSSLDDLLSEILAQDPALVKKVHVLEDCMSSVAVPDGKGGFVADFTPQAEQSLKRFADAGMHVVKSTVPMEKWAGL